MKKFANYWRTIAASVLLFGIYNLCIFLIPFDKEEIFWISYIFVVIAWIVTSAICLLYNHRGNSKSKIYGFPVIKIALVYGAAQCLSATIFMALGDIVEVWLLVLVNAVILLLGAVGLIGVDAVRAEVERQETVQVKNVAYMQSIQSKVNQMVNLCDDAESLEYLKSLSEEIRYSDPVSNGATAEIEADLYAIINALQGAVVDSDTASVKNLSHKAKMTLAERNRLCKLTKSAG